MREISALQELVAALSNLETLERFSCDASTCTGMNLTWSTGSATPGYKELQRAMSECVRGMVYMCILKPINPAACQCVPSSACIVASVVHAYQKTLLFFKYANSFAFPIPF